MPKDLLPILIPLLILEFGLALITIIDVLRSKNFKIGNKWIWFLSAFVTIIGPVIYFTIGRGERK